MRRSKSTIKSGPLGNEDKKYIERMCLTKTDEEIARHLRRTNDKVREYRLQFLTANPHIKIHHNDKNEVIEALHNDPEWDFIKKQFTKDELVLFENSYAKLMTQFKNDILETERKQIIHAITLEIFIHRHNTDRMLAQMDIERLEIILQREYKRPEVDKNIELITNLESQLQAARSSTNSRTKELKDLMDKHSSIIKDLKGTREQRIAKVERSKETFIGLLRMLEQDDMRQSIGVEMNLMTAAIEKEKRRLSVYHSYQDNSTDRPILNHETVAMDEE